MRKNSNGGYYDAMQVCLNGHYITELYYGSPQGRQNFCTNCGAKTIYQCPNCREDIKGHYHDSNLIFSTSLLPVPDICEYCGHDFPWRKINMDYAEGKDQGVASNISHNKKAEWIHKVSTAGSGNLLLAMLNEPYIQKDENLQSEIAHLSARWHMVEERQNKGLEKMEEVIIMKNQINDSLLKIIQKL